MVGLASKFPNAIRQQARGKPRALAARHTEGELGLENVVARLKVISGVEARARGQVILSVALGRPIRSNGDLTFECGNCGAVVLENVNLDQLRDCVVECSCGAFNEPPEAP